MADEPYRPKLPPRVASPIWEVAEPDETDIAIDILVQRGRAEERAEIAAHLQAEIAHTNEMPVVLATTSARLEALESVLAWLGEPQASGGSLSGPASPRSPRGQGKANESTS